MRRKTSKTRRYRHHVKVLKSEVMSPRIAWFTFLGVLKLATKVALIIGLLLALAYGIRQAIEHTFHKNPDFQLQSINLNPNDVLNETALVDLLGIDLAGNIFEFDIKQMEQELLSIPAISAVKVNRSLPGTLNFQITSRKPMAWVACPEESFPAKRTQGSLLVDHNGFPYPCPPLMVGKCQQLPILVLTPDPDHPITPGKILEHPQYKHCFQLLKAVLAHSPNEIPMIESIAQDRIWSLILTTKSGTAATFGLGNHKRQLDYLKQALDHAGKKGYQIATINLIPKQNVPITVFGDDAPPRAIPVQEEELATPIESRRNNDLRSLLNRN